MRPTLTVCSVVSIVLGVCCNASTVPTTAAAAKTPAAATMTGSAAKPADEPAPTSLEQSGRWRVVKKQNPMNDAEVLVATSRAKGAEGTYELEFSFAKDEFTVDYTIYGAEPLGLKPNLKGTDISFHKNIQWRFDKDEPNVVIADQSKEYANRFRLTTLDDAFARMGATNTRTTWGALKSAKTIVIQGLRDPGEYLEFPLDASFEPFRTIVAGTVASPAGTPASSSGVVGSISKDNVFLLNGRPTDPEVEGELELTIEKHLQFKNGDAFLLKNKGGTLCPTSYYWVFSDSPRTTVTPEFGTCAIASDVSEKDGALIVTMPSSPPTTYSFNGTRLLENGKPLSQ